MFNNSGGWTLRLNRRHVDYIDTLKKGILGMLYDIKMTSTVLATFSLFELTHISLKFDLKSQRKLT